MVNIKNDTNAIFLFIVGIVVGILGNVYVAVGFDWNSVMPKKGKQYRKRERQV
jgi:hypothetical protein